MPKLIVKPAINFLTTDKDAQLIAGVGGIVASIDGNPNYTKPTPDLAVVTASVDAFESALIAASLGGKLLTAIKNECRARLVALVRQLASYVSMACEGDLVILLSSGFPIHKPTRHKIGQLAAPRTPKLRRGVQTGALEMSARSIRGARIYTWRVVNLSSGNKEVQTFQSTSSKASLGRLIPGQMYEVSVNVVGTAGPSNWSNAASLMVV